MIKNHQIHILRAQKPSNEYPTCPKTTKYPFLDDFRHLRKNRTFSIFRRPTSPPSSFRFPHANSSLKSMMRADFPTPIFFCLNFFCTVRAPTYSDPEFDAESDFDNHFDAKILKNATRPFLRQEEEEEEEEQRETPSKTMSNSDLRFS